MTTAPAATTTIETDPRVAIDMPTVADYDAAITAVGHALELIEVIRLRLEPVNVGPEKLERAATLHDVAVLYDFIDMVEIDTQAIVEELAKLKNELSNLNMCRRFEEADTA